MYGAYTGLLSDIVIEPLETIPQELYFLGGYLAVTGLVIPFVGVLSSWRVLDRSEQDELNGLFIGSVVGNIVIFLGTFFSVGNAIITITP